MRQNDIDTLRGALASQPEALAALDAIVAALAEAELAAVGQDDLDEALVYGKGCAAALETVLKGGEVPPENMQHLVNGFWRAVGRMETTTDRSSTYFVRTALALAALLEDGVLAATIMDEQAAKVAADHRNGEHPVDTARRLYSVHKPA